MKMPQARKKRGLTAIRSDSGISWGVSKVVAKAILSGMLGTHKEEAITTKEKLIGNKMGLLELAAYARNVR